MTPLSADECGWRGSSKHPVRVNTPTPEHYDSADVMEGIMAMYQPEIDRMICEQIFGSGTGETGLGFVRVKDHKIVFGTEH